MKNVAIYPYRMGSKSASALSDALDVPQIRHKKSKFAGAAWKTVINWGASELPYEVYRCRVLNPSTKTCVTGNKLRFFQDITSKEQSNAVAGERSEHQSLLVPWTDQKSVAQEWLDKKDTVVVRKLLTSHSGSGILIVEPGEELPDAPLYTKYIKKDSEWRIHVMVGQIIFEQRKVRDKDQEPKSWKVRSHDNGFIFQHNDIQVPKVVRDVALKVMELSGLDFGGVDVICNKRQDKAWILEINAACGLEGTTVEVYSNAFRKLLTKGV